MTSERYILRVSCMDAVGIVADLAGFLAQRKLFILETQNFGDPKTGRFINAADEANPAVVKAVVAWDAKERLGRALYFTRTRAPAGDGVLYHHVGLYAYRREALENFVALPPSPLEQREKLEQLRALEAGMSIAVARVDEAPLSVDTPADLERARKLLS